MNLYYVLGATTAKEAIFCTILTFQWPGRYLNLLIFVKNVLFKQKKIKPWIKQHFVENKTMLMQHVLNVQHIFLLPKNVKWISGVVFIYTLTYVNVDCFKS